MGLLRNIIGTLLGNPVSATALVFGIDTREESSATLAAGSNVQTVRNNFGYLNNKKGFCSSYDSTFGTCSYAAKSINTPTGSQLVIDTYTGDSGKLNKKRRIVPRIPYRVMTNSPSFVKNYLKNNLLSQPAYGGGDLVFNPGISKAGSQLTLPSDFENGNTDFIELNLLRQDLNSYGNSRQQVVQTNGTKTLKWTVKEAFGYDTQASILVKKDSVNPERYDWLYLTVTTRVDLYVSETVSTSNSTATTDRHYFYATPVSLLFKIDKQLLGSSNSNLDVTPVSWGYPIQNASYSQITDLSDSGFSSDLWNYTIIPGTYSESDSSNTNYTGFKIPVSFGCITDTIYIDTNKVAVHTCFGKNYKETGVKYEQRNSVNYIEFQTNQMVTSNISRVLNWGSKSNYVANTIAIEYINSHYVAMLSKYTYDQWGRDTKLLTYFYILDSSFIPKTTISMDGVCCSDLFVESGTLYMKYVTEERKRYYYKFPTIDSSLISNLGSSKSLNYQQATNLFRNNSTLEWIEPNSQTPRPGYYGVKFRNYSANYESPETHLEDTHTQDFSILENIQSGRGTLGSIDVDSNMIMNRFSSSSHPGIIAYKFKDTNVSPTTQPDDSWYIGFIRSIYNDGFSSNHYVYADIEWDPDLKIQVYKYSPAEMTLGKPVVEYWKDPTLGANDETDDIDESDRGGVKLIVNVTGCLGLYSSGTLTINSFDYSLTPKLDNAEGGIPINTTLRPDLDFIYGGNGDSYQEQFGNVGGGYWAHFTNPMKVRFKTANGTNLLYGNTDIEGYKEIKGDVWHYDSTGEFNLYVPLDLDLTNAGADVAYTHPDFAVSGCVLDVNVRNRNNGTIASKTFTIDINPPDADGSITVEDNIYKTVGELITFNLQREARPNASDYTELHNISKNTMNISLAQPTHSASNPYSVKDNGQFSDTLEINNDLPRGSYYWISYEPKLHGIKPAIAENNGVAHTNYVTNCKGARFNLSDTNLYVGVSGVYGDDVLPSIQRDNPYFYVNALNSGVSLKVVTDIVNENWDVYDPNTAHSDYTSIQRYPGISSVYIVAAPKSIDLTSYFDESAFVPYDDATTYPNVDVTNNVIKRLSDGTLTIDGIFASGLDLGGTDAFLNNQEMIIDISGSDNYRIYLSVEDEFSQFSTWCITNPYTFNVPL